MESWGTDYPGIDGAGGFGKVGGKVRKSRTGHSRPCFTQQFDLAGETVIVVSTTKSGQEQGIPGFIKVRSMTGRLYDLPADFLSPA
jgi:hypothetical protein